MLSPMSGRWQNGSGIGRSGMQKSFAHCAGNTPNGAGSPGSSPRGEGSRVIGKGAGGGGGGGGGGGSPGSPGSPGSMGSAPSGAAPITPTPPNEAQASATTTRKRAHFDGLMV